MTTPSPESLERVAISLCEFKEPKYKHFTGLCCERCSPIKDALDTARREEREACADLIQQYAVLSCKKWAHEFADEGATAIRNRGK